VSVFFYDPYRMLKNFRLLPFVVGLVLGYIFLFKIFKPEKQFRYQFPHPSTVDAITYKDTNGVCYKYEAKEVNCDAHEGTLKEYPLQD
jgi:hypothetical protein